MIAACPDCGARYRIDPAKLPAAGARLRCSRCEAVFRVQAETPAPPPPAPVPEPVAVRAPAPAPPVLEPPTSSSQSTQLADLEAGTAAQRCDVLIAHPEATFSKSICDALSGWGLRASFVQDGVEAVLQIQRVLPRAVVLDAALPKMFGFQVCELMKRNEQLRSIPVVLVGAIHDRDRYRRPPQELYGADAYLERHEMPDGLVPLFRRLGVGGDRRAAVQPPDPPAPPAPPAPKFEAPVPEASPQFEIPPPPVEVPATQPVAPPVAQPEAAEAPADPDVEKAERLARIIVSDVILYNAEKFDAGLRAGNAVEALSSELEEGVPLFEQRMGSGRFDARQMLQDELRRQVLARSGQ